MVLNDERSYRLRNKQSRLKNTHLLPIPPTPQPKGMKGFVLFTGTNPEGLVGDMATKF